MRYQDLFAAAHHVLKRNPAQTIYVSGAPGLGKTSLCYELADALGIPRSRVLVFRPSLRDPVDLLGVPSVNADGATQFNPPAELAMFRAGTGPGLIVWDELPQGVTQMQNAIAGAMLDKFLGQLTIDPAVVQIATGNRTTDRAGANRIVSQLGNRVLHLEMEPHLDDWCTWAFNHNIDAMVIAFVRMRPALLHDFHPDRLSNPTPRSWEMVSSSCAEDLSKALRYSIVSGLIGEGAAAEYVAFRDTAATMPSIDGILMNPDTAPVPDKPGVLFAVSTALGERTKADNAQRVVTYINRMPLEFATLTVKDAMTRDPNIIQTRAMQEWCVKHGSTFI